MTEEIIMSAAVAATKFTCLHADYRVPPLDTGVLGGVAGPTAEQLVEMQTSPYVFHARGGKLTQHAVEKIRLPRDPAGNALSPGAAPNPWSLTCPDYVSPIIISTIPHNGSYGFNLAGDIIVVFSEEIDTESLGFICSPDPGGWSVQWSDDGTAATFSHDGLQRSTKYTFQILTAWDLAGNNLVTGSVANPWTFHTINNTSPAIVSTPVMSAEEEEEYTYIAGFTSAAVFGLEQTEGDPLPPPDPKVMAWLESLPLVEVAREWGLSVDAFNGKNARYWGYYN